MLPCVKYNHASETAQGCCQEYAGALHGGGGRRLSWVRYFCVSSRAVDVATPEIRSLPGWIFEGTHSPEERDKVWGGATRWRSFWDTILKLELLPRCRATLPRLGRRAHFRVSPMRKVAYAWVRCIRTVPTSIQTRPARKRSVTVILAQRENPLIEISAILTQCDRALTPIVPRRSLHISFY